jgi:diguanylate cyclase (GGDEF)-like protein
MRHGSGELNFMDFRSVGSILANLAARVKACVAGVFPLGISARLTLSLAAVALLAAAANMIARESVTIIRMVTRSPVPAVRTVPTLPTLPAPVFTPPTATNSATDDTMRVIALAIAVDRYERATQLRADIDSPAAVSEYLAARAALQRSSRGNTAGAPAVSAQMPTVAPRVRDYLDRGQALVYVADQRRQARIDYSRRSRSISDRLQHSLNGAWTVFGRVIERQSLLQMRTSLDAIREHSATILSGGGPLDAQDIPLILGSETEFATAFKANQNRLMKSEGAEWIRAVQQDFDAIVALRASLASLNSRHDASMQKFLDEGLALSTSIVAAARAVPAVVSRTPSLPVLPVLPALPARESLSATPALLGDTGAETLLKRSDGDARKLVFALTAVVGLLIAVISIFTVRSVITPVRRILKAFGQLAQGESNVEVFRGGLRELDTLAGAFNEMSASLTMAQQASRYQHERLEEKVLERTHKLQQLAQQDPLTSLPNRRHLSALLNTAIERAARDNRLVGVYFLDIDNFKNFNDSLGHVFGDRVLMSVANRLEEMADGLGFVARLGGDEFTFVYEDAASVQAINDVGWDLVRAFHKLVSVDQRELSVSVSVGASIFPVHENDAESLLRAADSALFRAKELGRSQLAMFTPQLIETAAVRFTVEQGLRRAIEGGEFELVYQPEVNLDTLETGLVEALLRWRLPDGRLIRPGEFLAVAEQSGLISEISTWVLRTAIADASRWHHGRWPDARVAINISPRQLLDHRFVDQLLSLLLEFRVPAKCIELELTETVLQTGSATIAALRVLQSHDIRIALDDFGTGYSSLTSLEQLPLSRIKLDRSLIASIDTSSRASAIARAIIDLCAGLGLEVTAEGIERPQQLAWLRGNHGMFLQGYLLSEAVSFAEVLQVKASLVAKLQDLLLSLPDKPHLSVIEPGTTRIRANR